jgi:hypothetical protein
MVSVRGKVVEQVYGDAAEKHIDKLAKKYMGLDKYPGRSSGEYDDRPFSLSLPRMVMFSYDVIVMESMISHIYGE